MPDIKPPPPTGIKNMSGTSSNCSTISFATVPWPAITKGSSKGWTNTLPSFFDTSKAYSYASSKESPYSLTFTPNFFTDSIFMDGVVVGITIIASILSLLADNATP